VKAISPKRESSLRSSFKPNSVGCVQESTRIRTGTRRVHPHQQRGGIQCLRTFAEHLQHLKWRRWWILEIASPHPRASKHRHLVRKWKSSQGKGYGEILQPTEAELSRQGFSCSFRAYLSGPLQDWHFRHATLDWYNSGQIVLCYFLARGYSQHDARRHGMRVHCSHHQGRNLLEFGSHAHNCIFIDRTLSRRSLAYTRPFR